MFIRYDLLTYYSKLDVGFQTFDGLRRKVFGEPQIAQRMDGTMQTAVFGNGLRLIEIDVRMLSKLIE